MLFLNQKGRTQVFNRKSTDIPQISMEYLKETVRGMRTEIKQLSDSMDSRHRNLETEWIKVQLLVKSQMGRIAKLSAIEQEDTPEVVPQVQETPSNENKVLTHDEIRELARGRGLIS